MKKRVYPQIARKINTKMITINASNLEEARSQIDKAYSKKEKIAVIGQNISFNRKILENKKVSILISPENTLGKDKLKERDSGLNHILCDIAKKNNVSIAIDFSLILSKKDKARAEHLARIMQNIKMYKKSKNNLVLINKKGKSKQDLFSFLLTIGLPTDIAKSSCITAP
ncbi:MAG: RNase P subunit p30 family protein [Nanoarchaeota archaeon]